MGCTLRLATNLKTGAPSPSPTAAHWQAVALPNTTNTHSYWQWRDLVLELCLNAALLTTATGSHGGVDHSLILFLAGSYTLESTDLDKRLSRSVDAKVYEPDIPGIVLSAASHGESCLDRSRSRPAVHWHMSPMHRHLQLQQP